MAAFAARCVFHNRRLISGFKNFVRRSKFSTDKMISVTFVNRDSKHLKAEAKEGQTLLDVVINNELDLEGYGACGGSLSCSTCHLILTEADYTKTESQITDEEMDLLDLSEHVTKTSRLGCQIVLNHDLNGMVVKVPKQVSDARQMPANQLDAAK